MRIITTTKVEFNEKDIDLFSCAMDLMDEIVQNCTDTEVTAEAHNVQCALSAFYEKYVEEE